MTVKPVRERRRVVVTGLGAVTAVGLNAEETWRNLLAGRSGVGRITQFDPTGYPSTIAAEVKDFRPPSFLDGKEARRMSRFELLALAATDEALKCAAFTINEAEADDVGVLVGSAIGSLTTVEHESKVMFDRGGMRMNPFLLPMMLGNMASAQISRLFGAHGYTANVQTACASG
ncbi:MAG TPA: beta-ketoacyl synthase N-terminal-like domain-containing protein, partial [Chloroflexota bacterium]|nr:beta-ketoacyl synthase N-terminal-like domain-containing protein [Chloroflexota bacterium]